MPEKIRIPVPDPFGLLEDLTEGAPVQLFDPLIKREAVKEEPLSGDQNEMYTHHLEQALRYAPCPGCKKVVIGGLTSAEIYKRMEETGMSVKDMDDAEIQKIKQYVKDKYGQVI
uniref:Uncharacterized protein n=1 Tax=viral metagenome TaxID=1070528 RepID=A0A6M3M856_9ZZZZ